MSIDWEGFKFYKQWAKKGDNFEMMIGFLKSECSLDTPKEIFLSMWDDEVTKLMLQKRDINSLSDMERYLYRGFNGSKSKED
ncbi:MAG: hypothetical protein WC144_05415 [Sulfurimonas sp.]|jgi:hypothetical protein|nr:hypothetical protein [Sulfurimonadaceae bacterium]